MIILNCLQLVHVKFLILGIDNVMNYVTPEHVLMILETVSQTRKGLLIMETMMKLTSLMIFLNI